MDPAAATAGGRAFRGHLRERVLTFSELSGARLLREIRQMGYEGSYTAVTDFLREVRPTAAKPFERRFETPPGRQAQMDFAEFAVEFIDEPGVSDLARNPQGPVARRIASVGPEAICVSIITAAELRYGCAKKGSPRLLAQVEAILDAVQVLALDVPADIEYGDIRSELEAAGQPIGPNDILIVAQACALDAVLLKANTREFSRIRCLKVENWLV